MRNIRGSNREWSANLWSRIKALFTGLDSRVTALEQGGGGGGGGGNIDSISLNGVNVPPDANKNVALVESDPTVPSWAKASTKPTYTASEVGALPDSTSIPSKTSDLQNDSGFISTETDPTVPSWAKQSSKPSYTASEVGAIPATQKGAASGVAELDGSGKVPSSQLPSYVDDVLEYASQSAFPATGETGKIYVATDTNKTYRWTGSAYVEISASLALGETSSTAYRGDRGKVAYDHAQAHGSAFASGLYKIATNAEGHVTGAVAPSVSDLPSEVLVDVSTVFNSLTGWHRVLTYADGSTYTESGQIVGTMQGASPSNYGHPGIVPRPLAGDESKFLRGDGTWAVPSGDVGFYLDAQGYLCQRIRSDT